MSSVHPKTNPRLYTHVLEAIAELKENSGSHVRTIVHRVQSAFNVSNGKPKLRNIALQVRRAIQHGIAAGVLRQKGGRVRLSLGNKNKTGIRACCGFFCGKKKKKGGSKVSKKGHRKRRHGKGRKGGGGHKKSRKRRGRSRSSSRSRSKSRSKSRSSSRSSGGHDPCAPRKKSKRHGSKRRKSVKGGEGGGKKRKRKHSSGGGSKHRKPKAPKRKKVRHAKKKKKPPECSVQQYSDEHNEEDDKVCTCQQNEDDQKDSHVSFADEDEICGDKLQSSDQCPEQMEKRKRSNRPPRRTSRQIRQGTPKNLDRCNPEFIAQQDSDVIRGSEHVPRSCNRSKEDYGVSKHHNTDYINKNFDNNDIHGTSQECDNPECLCNIKQEPLDTNEEFSKVIRDHCPERFSERKRDRDRARDPDRDRDHNPNKDRNPDRDSDRPRVRDRDRDRDGRENYFTN